MKLLSSLRSRIFLASAVLAILCIAVAIYLVGQRVTEEAERTLERDIVATGEQIDQLRAERTQTFTLMGLAAVQIQRDARGRQVGIEQCDEGVEQNRCASERRVREKEQLALRRNEIKSQYDTSAGTIRTERIRTD